MSDIQQLKNQVDDLTVALEQFGVFNLNATKKMGVFEKQQKKVTTALKRSPLNAIRLSLQGFAESITNVVKRGVLFANLNKKQQDDLKANMTVMEKLAAATIAHGVAVKFGNKMLDKKNTLFRRIMVSAFSLVSIFLIVGFALAALSLAFEGANSPLLTFTEDLGPLHDAMQGLVYVITGEGDEGGLATALDVLAAAFVTAGIASLALGTTVGVLAALAVLVVGAYRMFNAEFDNVVLAVVGAVGVLTTLIGSFLMLQTVVAAAKAGTVAVIQGTIGAIVAGVGLVVGGIAALVAFAMGAGEGIKGLLIGVLGAFAVFVGLFLITGLAIPAAITAAVLFVIAFIIRNWETFKLFLTGMWLFIKFLGSEIVTVIASTVKVIFGVVFGLLTGAFAIIVGLIGGFVAAVLTPFTSLKENVIDGGESLLDYFIKLPGRMWANAKDAFKDIFNGIIGIYNDFAEDFSFELPEILGGGTMGLPKIPLLAEGGIVTSPTLAVVGEDGPEAVVPLNRKNNPTGIGLGGGGMTVNINVGGVTDRTDKKQLAREIGDLIRAEMSRGGRSHGNRRSGV